MTKSGAAAVVCALVALAATAVARQSVSVPAGTHVAYVSGQRVSRESAEGMAGATRLQALQQEKTADLQARQQALESAGQELARASDAATRGRLEQEVARRRTELTQAVAQAQADIQNLQRQISNDLMAKVRPILEDLVAGTDIQVVLQADGPILWAAPGLDLTPAVLARLNAQPVSEASPDASR
jgi:Skp family chaperone for outer membrane proteins